MMVETVLESSPEFGLSGGALPQWKRELLQRRAMRGRPAPSAAPAPPPPPPPPPDADDDEELRYGPGIVKRLKSRYLSLALRDAPRRRPSVLRRAASLEHLLEAPAPAPRPPRPASLAAPLPRPAPRRDFVKRARSVDALSRLEPRDEPPPSPPPLPPQPRPPSARAARPPRRPAPLLRDTERPPPDLVRTTLRKFEPAPLRRTMPSPSPEPRVVSPAPAPASNDVSAPATSPALPVRPVSRAALEGIARAGCSTRYSFETPRRGGHLPPLSATNPVLLGRARRVGVIRPMPAPATGRATSTPLRAPLDAKLEATVEASPPSPPRTATPPPPPLAAEADPSPGARFADKRDPPLSALVEPIPRVPPDEAPPAVPVAPPTKPPLQPRPEPVTAPKPIVNGFIDDAEAKPVNGEARPCVETNGVTDKKEAPPKPPAAASPAPAPAPWQLARNGGARPGRAPPPAATSVVFNFSNRKDVPDYIENDGLILRASRRERIKAGEPGVVLLRADAAAAAGAGAAADSDDDDEADACRPPSPCPLRFVNDNVLINGRSSMLDARNNRDPHRVSKLKLQFDDSLTRTFEYPSETSLCEDDDASAPAHAPASAPAPASAHAHALAANTRIASAALSRYTPSKTCADAFQLGVAPAPQTPQAPTAPQAPAAPQASEADACAGDARPCGADVARSWSDARALATDLLF